MAARPVLNALEQLSRRHSLRVIWELRRDALGFSEIRDRAVISPSVLAQRLRELGAAGVLERDGQRRYRLTAPGRELARLLYQLNRWAETAARERRPPAGRGRAGADR